MSGVTEFMRYTREIQSVETKLAAAQDHTADPAKNYQKALGGKYIWDVCNENGEIASAVLVPTTEASAVAHAAESLARRPGFKPKILYCDTWPHNQEFWQMMFGRNLYGRLGLFHFTHRIIDSLRVRHYLHRDACKDLSSAIYDWHPEDYAQLVVHLKSGAMARKGEKPWDDEKIAREKFSKEFKDRFKHYLRKVFHPVAVIQMNLKNWFTKYKDQVDPITGKKLFTEDTLTAVDQQRDKAQHVVDTIPTEQLYRTLTRPRGSNLKHDMLKKKSLRCESLLESFHDRLGHFANTNMRQPLADYLNLMGTAHHNVTMRHRVWWNDQPLEDRDRIIESFAKEPMYFNHSNLGVINQWAIEAGCCVVPFPAARPLPLDNGERFFGAYQLEAKERRRSYIGVDRITRRCLCPKCGGNDNNLSDNNIESSNESEEEEDASPPMGVRFVEPLRPYSQRRPPQPPPPLPAALPAAQPVLIAPMPSQPFMPMAMPLPFGLPMHVPGPSLEQMQQMQQFRLIQLQRMQAAAQNQSQNQDQQEETEDCVASV